MVLRSPAIRWHDGLPSGNGSLGALVFGNILRETVVLNHEELFLPHCEPQLVAPLLCYNDRPEGATMDYDKDKVDEATLALMFLVTSSDKWGARAWKGFDWDTLDRLFEKGYISEPKGKARSVVVTDEGLRLSEELFRKYFGLKE